MFGINKKIAKTEEQFGFKIDYIHRKIDAVMANVDALREQGEKHDKAIEDILEALEPILIKNYKESLDSVVGEFEKALKELFGGETSKTRKKCAKSSAEKCKKCGETKKGEEKCSVAKKKSKKS